MLYRLDIRGDIEYYIPTIPDNYFTKNGYEDNKIERVCFALSIEKCLMALSQKCNNMELYVYIPDEDYSNYMYKPTTLEVPDSEITNEVWITKQVKVKCIGKIKVIGSFGKHGYSFKYGDKTAKLYNWNWKWL